MYKTYSVQKNKKFLKKSYFFLELLKYCRTFAARTNGVALDLTVKTLVCKHVETWSLARKSEFPKK